MREHSRIAQRNLREALHGAQNHPAAGRATDPPPGLKQPKMKSDIHWMPARITACRDLTPTVREFEITPESGVVAGARARRASAGAGAGRRARRGRMQTRSYSLVGEPDGRAWRIAVKRLDDGRGGSLAMWRLAAGDRLLVSEPQNHFGARPRRRRATCWWPAASASRRWSAWRSAWRALAERSGVPRAHALRRPQRGRTGLPAACCSEALGDAACRPRTRAARRSTSPPRSRRCRPAASSTPAARCRCSKRVKRAWAGAGRPPADLRFETFGSSGRLRDAGLRGAHSAPRPGDHGAGRQHAARSARGRRRADAVGLPARRMRPVRDGRARGRRRDRPPRRVPQRAREGGRASASAPACRVRSARSRSTRPGGPKVHEPCTLCAIIAQPSC